MKSSVIERFWIYFKKENLNRKIISEFSYLTDEHVYLTFQSYEKRNIESFENYDSK